MHRDVVDEQYRRHHYQSVHEDQPTPVWANLYDWYDIRMVNHCCRSITLFRAYHKMVRECGISPPIQDNQVSDFATTNYLSIVKQTLVHPCQ
jgi:hypothetical protein